MWVKNESKKPKFLNFLTVSSMSYIRIRLLFYMDQIIVYTTCEVKEQQLNYESDTVLNLYI